MRLRGKYIILNKYFCMCEMGGCSETGLCLYVIPSACVAYQKFCNMDLSLYMDASHSHHGTTTFT